MWKNTAEKGFAWEERIANFEVLPFNVLWKLALPQFSAPEPLLWGFSLCYVSVFHSLILNKKPLPFERGIFEQ
jgi:hypothetical protein